MVNKNDPADKRLKQALADEVDNRPKKFIGIELIPKKLKIGGNLSLDLQNQHIQLILIEKANNVGFEITSFTEKGIYVKSRTWGGV